MVNKSIEDAVQSRQTVEPNLVDPSSFAGWSAGANSLHPLVLIGPILKGAQSFQVLPTFIRRETFRRIRKPLRSKRKRSSILICVFWDSDIFLPLVVVQFVQAASCKTTPYFMRRKGQPSDDLFGFLELHLPHDPHIHLV